MRFYSWKRRATAFFDPFAAQLPLDDSPNAAVENLWPWISKMGLSAQDAAAAEAHLQDIEAREAATHRGETQKKDAPASQAQSDPFAPAADR